VLSSEYGSKVDQFGSFSAKSWELVMSQTPLAETSASPIRAYWAEARLTWKITGTFVAILTLCGVLTMGLVYVLTSRLLNEQIEQRARNISKNLADVAAGHIVTKNLLALHAVAAKYSFQDNIAYISIRGRDGRILAHSLGGVFPAELENQVARADNNLSGHRNLLFQNRPVYETIVPIMGGQLGTTHVGIWRDTADSEIKSGLLPILGLIAVLFLIASIISLLLSRHLVNRISRLQSAADRVSKGNLEESVGGSSGDEIDQLAVSLERMRTSLKAALAMARLRHADLQTPAARRQGEVNETA
jgi:HAMP domain-containing protein